MEFQSIIQLVKDLSYPAVFALFILIILKPLLPLIISFFRSRINGSTDPTIHEKLNKIAGNDLHEISGTLSRIERKLDKLDTVENMLIRIDTKLNNK